MAKAKARKPKVFDRKNFVVAQLRRASYRSPLRYAALSAARVAYGRYRCAECRETFGPKEIQIDHIEPCIDPAKGWQGFDVYIERLFCEVAGLQVLCKPCHQEKSNRENSKRRQAKK